MRVPAAQPYPKISKVPPWGVHGAYLAAALISLFSQFRCLFEGGAYPGKVLIPVNTVLINSLGWTVCVPYGDWRARVIALKCT